MKHSLCLLLTGFATSVLGQRSGGQLVCQEKWEEGRKVTLRFTVDRAAISTCPFTNKLAVFRWRPNKDSLTTDRCTVQADITSPQTCDGSFQPGTLGCGCTGANETFFTVEYNFIADSAHNGWWSGYLECINDRSVQQVSYDSTNCDDRKVQQVVLSQEFDALKGLIAHNTQQLESLLSKLTSLESAQAKGTSSGTSQNSPADTEDPLDKILQDLATLTKTFQAFAAKDANNANRSLGTGPLIILIINTVILIVLLILQFKAEIWAKVTRKFNFCRKTNDTSASYRQRSDSTAQQSDVTVK